jgi:Abortive infection C-terminus
MLHDAGEQTPLEKVQRLQDGLVAFATGGRFDGDDPAYQRLRRELLDRAHIRDKVPDFVRRYRDLGQFWQFIKGKLKHYAERREFIWGSFSPLIDYLEAFDQSPGTQPIGETLQAFDSDNVHAAWQKALDRRIADPEGAITAARTLLESVCKHILDDTGVKYSDDADLPRLWALSAEALNLAPQQHQEKLFKAILGNCQAVVNSLGALRNKIGDAHGSGRRPVKPKPRHAELAVNLAGAMAAFLVATLKEKRGS